MRAILNHCGDIPLEHVPGGTVLLKEGQNTGRVYILAQGRIEVIRGDTQVAVLDEPGSLVGEMSVGLPAFSGLARWVASCGSMPSAA